jgi:hypothetical protein
MPWHRSGRWGEGPRTETALARLELKPAVGSSNEKEQTMAMKKKKKKMAKPAAAGK